MAAPHRQISRTRTPTRQSSSARKRRTLNLLTITVSKTQNSKAASFEPGHFHTTYTLTIDDTIMIQKRRRKIWITICETGQHKVEIDESESVGWQVLFN